MTDLQVIALAFGCALGAVSVVAVPVWVAAAVVAGALVMRWPWLVIVAASLLAAGRAHDAWAAMEQPVPARVDAAEARLVDDPVRAGFGTSVVVEIDDRRLLAGAYGPTAARLAERNAGDRVQVSGTTRWWDASRERHAALRTTHRLTIETIAPAGATPPLWRLANALRGEIHDGAEGLGPDRRALFTGLVYGDDRFQPALLEADFRLAGLTHLLAVSGQNVAYLLVLLAPLLRRCNLSWRWLITIGALVIFATATRFEPSVLRATVMAAIAATGALTGREAASLRILALAVASLTIYDPLLVHTIAFRLSVAASAGIIVLRGPIAARWGGGPVASALAVTVSAQLAVAPLLIATFGPISVVSIPANLLAGPAAGLVMGWGMTAGLVAGIVGGPTAGALHACTWPALWWLETVAHASAAVPLAPVGIVWIAAAVLVWCIADGLIRIAGGRVLAVAAAVVMATALVPSVPNGTNRVGPGGQIVALDGTVVLVLSGRDDPVWLLEDLRDLGVRTIAVAVTSTDDRQDLDAVVARLRVDRVWRHDPEESATTAWIPLGPVEVRILDRAPDDPSVEIRRVPP